VANEQAAIRELALRLGLSVSEPQWRAIDSFFDLLLAWNARINLTGARTRSELLGEHLADSVAMAHLVPPGARVLDVGSGGGLPAIPFALLRPDVSLTLVEPRAKRAAFLRTAVREMKLSGADVLLLRLESLPSRPVDVAGSRATFAPAEWLAKARPVAARVVVFATQRGDVGAAPGLEAEAEYQTATGHPRWTALFRST
jgi:16S rRNA (guanine527-N7)-methyltransferase